MATRNIVPRANGEGSIGTAVKHWGNGYFDELNTEKLVADDVIMKGPVVDVRAFGAKGDGITDDTAAFRTALNAAKGNTLVVPNGNYNITSPLFADDVKSVIDNGTYVYAKPVYPKTDAFIKGLDSIVYEGTVQFTSTNSEYPQGMCVDRNTGDLIVAGVYNTFDSQTLYRVQSDAPEIQISSYSYTELEHANAITHCPELGKYIVAFTRSPNTGYCEIDDNSMNVISTKTLPFPFFGITWDPICKLFVAYHFTGYNEGDYITITLHILDINLNEVKTTSIQTTLVTSHLNSGCCYDGRFVFGCFNAIGECSLLGKEISLFTFGLNYELEGFDFDNNGKLYLTNALESNKADVFSCNGYKRQVKRDTLYNYVGGYPIIGRDRLSDVDFMRNPNIVYLDNVNQMAHGPFDWGGGYLLNINQNNNVDNRKQIFFRITPIENYKNDIAIRTLVSGGWTEWEHIAVGDFLPLKGGTITGSVRFNTSLAGTILFTSTSVPRGTTPTSGKTLTDVHIITSNNKSLVRKMTSIRNDGTVNDITRIYRNKDSDELAHLTLQAPLSGNFILSPDPDNVMQLGAAAYRWTELYAATGTINTSDERLKDNIYKITDELLDAWGEVNWCQFQFKDAIEEKGEKARFHNGLIAQRIKEVFDSHNLDVTKYGLFCYDEWEAEEAEYDNEGNIIREAIPAGNRYSLRYEECLALEAAYQRRRADKLEERIRTLEEKMNLL
jgi:hypothetical protein